MAGPDTAGSAKFLQENKEEGLAAIASELAAEIYGLEKVQIGIEDYKNNHTRFFVVGKGKIRPKDPEYLYKTSIIFALGEAGLVECLNEF